MYRPVRTIAPAVPPLNRATVKEHLDVGYADKDALIDALQAAAVSYLDGWSGVLGRCLSEQTWRQDFDRFARCLRLPLAPVINVASVKYDDVNDIEQTIAPTNYTLLEDDLGPHVVFADNFAFPAIHGTRPALRVSYVAGYATSGVDPNIVSAVPSALKHAVLMLVRHWFDNPSAVVVGVSAQSVPLAVEALITPFRRVRF